jgi:hypothetical protein
MLKKIILLIIGILLFCGSGFMVWNYIETSRQVAKDLAKAKSQATEPVEPEMTIKVYFGNKNMALSPNDCTSIFPVERVVPNDLIVRRRAIEEFLAGPTPGEVAQGYFSGLPTKEEIIAYRDKIKTETGAAPYEGEEIKIKSVKILAGAAYVVFSKEFLAYGADPCRLGLIKAALRESLKQFPRVGGVMISIEGKENEMINP